MEKNTKPEAVAAPKVETKPSNVIEIPFDVRSFPDADRISYELNRELRELREWRDQSANSTVLVS